MSEVVDGLVAQAAKGQGKAVYLFHGEEFLARKAAEALVAALVPEGMRDLNVSLLEAAASPAEVARDLATLPMFRSAKVVWLRDPEWLAPKKAGRADQLGRLRELWGQGRQKEATRRLLALAQKAGVDPARADAAAWESAAGITADGEDLAFCREAAAYAAEQGMEPPSADTAELERLLDRGIPQGSYLVISALSLDGRLGTFKRLKDAGVEVSFKPQGREGRDVGALAADYLEPLGKRLVPAAAARLTALVGGDQVRLLHGELEKLALYVGERRQIEPEDVDAVVERSREIEFLLTNSLEKRDVRGALEGLDQLLAAGGGLPQAVASIGACVRMLLAAHEATRAQGGRLPGFGPGATGWVAAYAESGLKMGNPNQAKFKAEAAARFTREELARALARTAAVDQAVKSGGGRLDVERLIWEIASPR